MDLTQEEKDLLFKIAALLGCDGDIKPAYWFFLLNTATKTI